MEIANLMQSMSLREPDNEKIFISFAAEIEGNKTDIVCAEYFEKYMVIATQFGKLGNLVEVRKDTPNEISSLSEPVFSIRIIFGTDDIEHQAAVRYIAEKLDFDKRVLMFICLKNYELSTLKSLVSVLTETFKNAKQNL